MPLAQLSIYVLFLKQLVFYNPLSLLIITAMTFNNVSLNSEAVSSLHTALLVIFFPTSVWHSTAGMGFVFSQANLSNKGFKAALVCSPLCLYQVATSSISTSAKPE